MRLKRLASAIACALVVTLTPGTLAAQGVMLQGIVDAEYWSTDTSSNMLTRRGGSPAGLGRLVLWGAVEPRSGFVLYAAGSVERGARASRVSRYAEIEQLGARYSRSEALMVDAGRMPSPVGAFSARRFSTRNPLIGVPDGYPVQYPIGAMASGVIHRRLDYRMGVMSRAVAHEVYVPEPGFAMRPVVGIGFTPMVGVRIGASGTAGPYLNDSLSAAELHGRAWTAYGQRIGALDVQLSRGYAELRAEWARSEYEIAETAAPARGTTYYVEGRYTITPRLYGAARYERNRYPFIRPSEGAWIASITDFTNAEAGLGFRLTASTLIKASYRGDDWVVTPQNASFIRPGGRAFAIQVSQAFDAVALAERGQRR